MTLLTHAYSAIVERDYNSVDNGEFFGLVRRGRDLEGHLQLLRTNPNADGPVEIGESAYFVKRMRSDETENMPPNRFVNAVLLYGGLPYTINPVAVFFDGRAVDTMVRPPREGYFVSDYIQGPTLIQRIGDLSQVEKDFLFEEMGKALAEFRGGKRRIFLMDFAPRDIVLIEASASGLIPVFVDTEHMEIAQADKPVELLLEQQVAQFNEDYAQFLDDTELPRYRQLVFGQ